MHTEKCAYPKCRAWWIITNQTQLLVSAQIKKQRWPAPRNTCSGPHSFTCPPKTSSVFTSSLGRKSLPLRSSLWTMCASSLYHVHFNKPSVITLLKYSCILDYNHLEQIDNSELNEILRSVDVSAFLHLSISVSLFPFYPQNFVFHLAC